MCLTVTLYNIITESDSYADGAVIAVQAELQMVKRELTRTVDPANHKRLEWRVEVLEKQMKETFLKLEEMTLSSKASRSKLEKSKDEGNVFFYLGIFL